MAVPMKRGWLAAPAHPTHPLPPPLPPLLPLADYGCHLPQRDVVTPPYDARQGAWLNATLKMSVEDVLARKKK